MFGQPDFEILMLVPGLPGLSRLREQSLKSGSIVRSEPTC
jgi:hypothetical protein